MRPPRSVLPPGPGFRPAGFSLVEILSATAILSVMFTIMFGILQQTSAGWQAANRRVESAQAARLGLEQIAYDLENCVVVIATNVRIPGVQNPTNYAFGFVHSNGPTSNSVTPWLEPRGNGLSLSEPNDILFLVVPQGGSVNASSDPSNLPRANEGGGSVPDLWEVGYIPVFVHSTTNYKTMKPGRYTLLRHFPLATNSSGRSIFLPNADFMTNPTGWERTPDNVSVQTRAPFIDNCVKFDVRFLYQPTNVPNAELTNVATWGRPSTNAAGGWEGLPAQAAPGLPVAAEITLCVLDDRTAERLNRLTMLGQRPAILPRTLLEGMPTNWIGPANLLPVLRSGVVTFQRRVYFRNAVRTNL